MSVEPDLEKTYEGFLEKRLGDGLPIVPPTEERVLRMLEFTDRKPDDALGKVPPSEDEATIEAIAANAVMAGCKPEYFPVVVTEIDAMLDRPNLRGALATTRGVWPMGIVNGPIGKEIGLYTGAGVFGTGPYHRANVTIGRTMTLVCQNIGKSVPGESEKKPMWNLGRYGICIRENEEESPWEPLHVEKGFDRDTSTVTVYSETGLFHGHRMQAGLGRGEPREIALAKNLVAILHSPPAYHEDASFYFIGPNGAKYYADKGWSKRDVQNFFYEHCRSNPKEWFTEEIEKRDDVRGKRTYFAYAPKWWWEAESVPLLPSPDHLWIVVTGGGGYVWMPSSHHGQQPTVMKPITFADGTPVKSVYDFKRKNR
jgi:hypothetical protein